MGYLPNINEYSSHFHNFINIEEQERLLSLSEPTTEELDCILKKSLNKEPLTLEETASLLRVEDPQNTEKIFEAARELKRLVYGNRIVLFAPLYVGSNCINDCKYCSFQRSNQQTVRKTLTTDELKNEVTALENLGHKRLILVWGEHPEYTPEYIADCVKTVYATKAGKGEIRRVNINAAPLDHEGYKIVKASGIGTYQIFQETYHLPTYQKMHPQNTRKGNFLWRLDGLSRALEAGCDDVGIGALFGLYDWKFETLSLVQHAIFLKQNYNVGPHTISFPRIQQACGVELDPKYQVSDEQFKRLVAILRLAVPYTGLIMTARENAKVRREVLAFGVSQIDAGSRIEIGGYTESSKEQIMEREQFCLGDVRSLDSVICELAQNDYIPSFCTACYRLGRTGEHFMEFAIPGFIKRFCSPNAICTFAEYLVDYASEETQKAGWKLIEREIDRLPDASYRSQVVERLQKIKEEGVRDLYF